MLMKSKNIKQEHKTTEETSFIIVYNVIHVKLPLCLINMISAIGIGAKNTPFMTYFPKHSPQYIRSRLHNPNKHKPINPLVNLSTL